MSYPLCRRCLFQLNDLSLSEIVSNSIFLHFETCSDNLFSTYFFFQSFREEKRKRKKDKHVYDALQRINEASDERDSASLKSRESGSINPENNGALPLKMNCGTCLDLSPKEEDIVTTMLNGQLCPYVVKVKRYSDH